MPQVSSNTLVEMTKSSEGKKQEKSSREDDSSKHSAKLDVSEANASAANTATPTTNDVLAAINKNWAAQSIYINTLQVSIACNPILPYM